jgi:pantothenate kinase type III
MKITIDIGNSYSKILIHKDHLFNRSFFYKLPNSNPESELEKITLELHNDIKTLSQISVILSNVNSSHIQNKILLFLKENLSSSINWKVHNACDFFNKEKPLFQTMPVNYTNSIGIYRLLVAFPIYEKQIAALVIDAGTFTTVDYVDETGFKGGVILPGLELLQNCYTSGNNLKDFNPQIIDASFNIAQDTPCAINNGLTLTFLSPLIRLIENHQHTLKSIVVSGGHCDQVEVSLKNYLNKKIFDSVAIDKRPLLIHEGMFSLI